MKLGLIIELADVDEETWNNMIRKRPNILRRTPKENHNEQQEECIVKSELHSEDNLKKKLSNHKCNKPNHSIKKLSRKLVGVSSNVKSELDSNTTKNLEFKRKIKTECSQQQTLQECSKLSFETNILEDAILTSDIYYLNDSNIAMIDEDMLMNLNTNFNATNTQYFSKLYQCDWSECNQAFVSEDKLVKHKLVHIKDVYKILCPAVVNETSQCNQVFFSKQELVEHIKCSHCINDAPFKCDQCSRRFFWQSSLCAHMRSHSQSVRMIYPCSWANCSKVFRHQCRLNEHIRTHTGDKPYPCKFPKCKSAFRTASKLERHSRTHIGHRRYMCPICANVFLRRDHLRTHYDRHAPKTMISCVMPGCDQQFNNKGALYRHLKKVHKNLHKQIEVNSDQSVSSLAKSLVMVAASTLELNQTDEPVLPESQQSGDTNITNTLPQKHFAFEIVEHVKEAILDDNENNECHAARTHCTWPLNSADKQNDKQLPGVQNTSISNDIVYTVNSKDELFFEGNDKDLIFQNEILVSDSNDKIFMVPSNMFSNDDKSYEDINVLSHDIENNDENLQFILLDDCLPRTQLITDPTLASEAQHLDLNLNIGTEVNEQIEDKKVGVEHMMPVETEHLESDLGLLETSMTNFLQEEFLFTPSSQDESSFQVLLLQGQN